MIVGRRLSWHIILRYTGRGVALHVLFALTVIVGYRLFDAEWLSVPAMPVSVLAAALGVLLAFRNGSAYDRWWEARSLWGGVVNWSRTFARQVLTLLPRPEREASEPLTELELAPPSSPCCARRRSAPSPC
ncbi:bestrophin family ion channel [Myxococcus sp. 1LA]